MKIPKTLYRSALIIIVLCLPLLCFAYVAGWLSPTRLTSSQITNQLEALGGDHAGYRRNHAKGICFSGTFIGSGNAGDISSAAVFGQQEFPVVGRFSIPGGNPYGSDKDAPLRSFALKIDLGNGEEWRMALNSSPVFIVAQPQDFYGFLQAQQAGPEKVTAFFENHPETVPFLTWVKSHTPSDSFGNTRFNSNNSLVMVNKKGERHYVRWSILPELPFTQKAKGTGNDYLFEDMAKRLADGELRWHLQLQIANGGDPVNDATKAWPENRHTLNAGTLILRHSSPQASGECRDINFDPLILPDGIEASEDPILHARSAVYSTSFTRRVTEQAKQEKH